MKFLMRAEVTQVVTKELSIVVSARTKAEAEMKVRAALQVFPEGHTVQGIHRIEALKHTYQPPVHINLEKEEPVVA
jgi:hypothetical protein